MSIGRRLCEFLSGLFSGSSFFVKSIDDFFVNVFAGLVAVDVYEEVQSPIVLKYWEGFGAKFIKASAEGLNVLVVLAVAAVAEDFSGFKTSFDVSFGDI